MKVKVLAGKVLYRTEDALIVLSEGPEIHDVPQEVYLANIRQLQLVDQPVIVHTTQLSGAAAVTRDLPRDLPSTKTKGNRQK